MRTSRGTTLSRGKRKDRRYLRTAEKRIAALEAKGEFERANGIRVKVGKIAVGMMLNLSWHAFPFVRPFLEGNEIEANESRVPF